MATAVAPETQTAPAGAVVQAPEATPAPTTATGMESVIAKMTHKPIPQDGVETVVTPDGQVPPNAEVVTESPGAEAAPTETPAQNLDLVQEVTADEPEGQVVLRARDPKTGEFRQFDKTMEFELSIRDKETGETKVYNKNAEQLMRLAKDGISARKQLDELHYYRQNTPEWQRNFQGIQQKAEGLEALAVQLLTADEPTVVALRQQYQAELTPEKELARLKAQIAQQGRVQAETQQQQTLRQNAAAFGAKVAPIVQSVAALVGEDAAAGKLARETSRFMVNGTVPPERFAELEAFITGPYKTWAENVASASAETKRQAEAATKAANEAKVKAQQAVQATGRAIRPVGSAGPDRPAVPPKPKNVNEAMERIIKRPVAVGA